MNIYLHLKIILNSEHVAEGLFMLEGNKHLDKVHFHRALVDNKVIFCEAETKPKESNLRCRNSTKILNTNKLYYFDKKRYSRSDGTIQTVLNFEKDR